MQPLPLVSLVCSIYSDISLKNICIIGIQNLLPTTARMFYSLILAGLKPCHATLLGKCYSTSPDVVDVLQKLGVKVSPFSTSFRPEMPFDENLNKQLDSFFKSEIENRDFSSYSKVVVMDDGGDFLLKLQQIKSLDSTKFVGIEQTTSGFKKLKDIPLQFPIINVGRSEAKLQYESSLIASSLVAKLKERLNNLPYLPRSILVVGAGSIGRAVFSTLREEKKFKVDLFEQSNEIEDFQSQIGKYDMIIGCTGKVLIDPSQYQYLKKDAILVSASYSDIEFSAHSLRSKSQNIQNCHQDLHVDNLYLLNCGFPVNFDNRYETVDPEAFQLTRALLVSAIFQGVKGNFQSNELIDLDLEAQKKIINGYLGCC